MLQRNPQNLVFICLNFVDLRAFLGLINNFFWRNSLRVKSLTFQNSGLSSASEWYCVSDYEWHLWQTWYTSINYQNLKKLSAESILVRFCQPCKVRKKLLLEQMNSHSNISDDGGEENLCGLLALGSWVRCGALAHCVTISLFTPTLIMMMTMNMVTMVMVMLHINMLPIFSQCSPPTIASSKMFIFFSFNAFLKYLLISSWKIRWKNG